MRFKTISIALALAATLLSSLSATAQWSANTISVFLTNANKNVGIGTSTPHAPLQFANGVVNRKIVLFEDANNDHQFYGFGINGAALRYQVGSVNSSHVFYAATGPTTSVELMRLKGTGQVGIGTSNPALPLEVRSTGGGQVRLSTTSLAGYTLWAGGSFNIVDVPTDQIRFSIRNNGFIGIGTTAPSSKLHVAGDVRCINLFTSSDRRYKTGIRTFESALDKVLAMRGTTYDFAAEHLPEDFKAGKQVGFIAQEMQEVMPELVKEDTEGMLSVNYLGVIPVLVEALKEQHKVMAEKESRIVALEAQNTALQDRLARIEAALGIAAERQTEKPAVVNATISPNPTSGMVTITLSNTASAKSVTVRILDSAGREVVTRNVTGEGSIQFDLRPFPAGMYVAQVVADGKTVCTEKVQMVK